MHRPGPVRHRQAGHEEPTGRVRNSSSVGRSLATLLIMLVCFALLCAFFLAIDNAAGVRVRLPSLIASAPTPTHSGAASPTAPLGTRVSGATVGATPSQTRGTQTVAANAGTNDPTVTAVASASPAGQVTETPAPDTPTATPTVPMPTPADGVTPPRYGALPNYPNDTSFTADYLSQLAQRIIDLTNQQRVAHGLSKLSPMASLDIIAASRSQDMIQRHYFDHYDPTSPLDARGHHLAAVQELLTRNHIAYQEVGENLISNTGRALDDGTPAKAVQAWMDHPEHRANILHPSYTQIGVGIAATYQNNVLHVIITQILLR